MKFVSQAISIIFHPLFLTTYTILIGFSFPGYLNMLPYEYKKMVFIVFALITSVFPVIFLLLMYNMKLIKSIRLEQKKDRNFPLAMVLIFYISAYIIALQFPVRLPIFIKELLFIGCIVSIMAFGLNFWFKVSLHTLGITANLYFILSNFFIFEVNILYTIIIGIITVGAIASARLYLNAHKPVEVWAGGLCGIAAVNIAYFFSGLIVG